MSISRLKAVITGVLLLAGAAARATEPAMDSNSPTPGSGNPTDVLSEVTVTARRIELIGTASTASEGIVSDPELQLTPAYRPGQLLETVPGLIVTLHSGEGKANQYLLRGYNLDHGTDLATFVDGMPVNQVTHAHGQGYTDLNFLIPELAEGISYTKGPYYAEVGDFGAVGSLHVGYRDTIDSQLSATLGTLGFERLFGAGSVALGDGHLLGAIEAQHYDGPFVTPDDARKLNLVLRYAEGDQRQGYSVTAMGYHQDWTNTTDIPVRAVSEGLVPGRFGSLDPTDGGQASRASLSLTGRTPLGTGQLAADAFLIYNRLDIYNNFTHFLINPNEGDQEHQFENRRVGGAAVRYALPWTTGTVANEILTGAYTRYDSLDVGRSPSVGQADLPASTAPPSYSNHDQVYLYAGAAYLQLTSRYTPQLRSVLGLREDYQHGTDVDYLAALHETAGYSNGGTVHQWLAQPKASLIFTPNEAIEFYASIGRGFHSADLRGVNQDQYPALELPATRLLSRQEGQEVGVRSALGPALTFTLALYNLWQQSETIINPDIGQDSAGPPSRRYGFELNVTYEVNRHLELYASYSADHARFTRPLDDGTGHLGTYITDAPVATGSLALYLKDFGRFSGGLNYRYLGNYPLSSGPCVDAAAVRDFPHAATSCADAPTAPGQVNGHGFGELNLDLHYAIASGWSTSLGIYNVLNTHASAAEFWYVDRLQNEIAVYPDGRADVHQHPLEPLMARLTLTRLFGR